MPLRDFVNPVIAIDSIGIALSGFGIPMIPSASPRFPADFTERVRSYTDLAGLAEDWDSDEPEYLAGRTLLSQTNPPEAIMIGRCELPPTMRYAVGVATVYNSTAYKIRAQGPGVTDTTVSITSGGSATAEAIHNALVTAVNAVVGKNFLATFAPLVYADDTFSAATTDICTNVAHGLKTGDGPFQLTSSGTLPAGLSLATDYWIIRLTDDTFKFAASLALALAGTAVDITDTGSGTHTISDTVSTVRPFDPFLVTGDAAGEWFSLEVLDSSGNASSRAVTFLSIEQTHADPGIATDLDAIADENSSWYCVYPLYNSKAYGTGVMAWVEAQPKTCVVDSCDSHIITAAAGGSDIADTAKAASYDRTLGNYHPSPIDFLGAALMGEVLPLTPGQETWAFKSNLSGPRGVNLSSTHRTNLRAKNWNTYEPQTTDITWTWDGKTPGGEFFDTTRGLDSVVDDATKSIATVLANDPKVPYTDGGALRLGNELEGVGVRAVTNGVASPDPAPVVIIPRVATQSAANRRARKFVGLKLAFTLAGAIHKLDPVNIVVTQ